MFGFHRGPPGESRTKAVKIGILRGFRRTKRTPKSGFPKLTPFVAEILPVVRFERNLRFYDLSENARFHGSRALARLIAG